MHDELSSNIRGHFAALFISFFQARGDVSERVRVKQQIKQACRSCQVTWDKVCEWFRETLRTFEKKQAALCFVYLKDKYPEMF